jgi:hypothetical protein
LLAEIREGWVLFRTTTWLWVVVLALAAMNVILLFGPLASAYGVREVLTVGGVVYVVIALATLLSRDVRTLGRVSTTSPPAP